MQNQAMLKAGAGLLAALCLGGRTLGQESQVRETEWPGGQAREKYEVRITPDGQEIRHGDYESWFENGKRSSKGDYEDGKRSGAWMFFAESGKKESNGRFKEGLRNGKWRLYHPSGKLKGEGEYLDDFMYGEWSFIDEDGDDDPLLSGNYRYTTLKYPAGATRGRGYLRNDALHGEWVYFWENGRVQYAGRYVNGRREGEWVFQHSDGTFDDEMLSGVFEQGERVKLLHSGELPDFAEPIGASEASLREAAGEAGRTEIDELLDFAGKGRGNQREEAVTQLVARPTEAVPGLVRRLQECELSNPRELARAVGSYGGVLSAICGGAQYPFEDPATGKATPDSVALAAKRWASLWALTGPGSDFWSLDAKLMDASSPEPLYLPPFPALDRGSNRWFSSSAAGEVYAGRFDERDADVARTLDEAYAWLASQQSAEGGWDADAFAEDETIQGIARMAYHDVGVSALALLAYMAGGNTSVEGPYRDHVALGLGWLAKQLRPDGSIESLLAESELSYDQALVALCLCEAAAISPSPALAKAARNAVEWVLKARNEEAGWYYGPKPTGESSTSLSAWMTQALFAARKARIDVDPARIDDAFEGVRQWIASVSDRRTGRVGYKDKNTHSLRMQQNEHYPRERAEPMTAAGLFCHAILGTDPKTEIIPRHVYRIKKAPPLWSRDGLSCDMYYWYFASNGLYQYGGDAWEAWWKAWSNLALRAQRKKDDAKGSWDPIGPWGFVGGRVYSTAIMALALQTPWRLPRFSEIGEGQTAKSDKGKKKRRG